MKLRIMLGETVNAGYYVLLKGKKREVLSDLSDIVHALAAAKKSCIVEQISLSPATEPHGGTIGLDSHEEICAVLTRCKAYRKELALQLLEKVKA